MTFRRTKVSRRKARRTPKKKVANPRVPRTRNGGTWTEAEYWTRVRSALRKAFADWKPAKDAIRAATRPNTRRETHPRRQIEAVCESCHEPFWLEEVQADHVVPCGSLRSADDLAGFLARLTPENVDAFQCVCKACHNEKTQLEAAERRAARKEKR